MSRLLGRLTIVFLLILVSLFIQSPQSHGQSAGGFSTIYFSPERTCCSSPNVPYPVGSDVTVGVNLNLAAGQYVNVFDVLVNYTNGQNVLRTVSLNFANSIFYSPGNTPFLECIDGREVMGSCPVQFIGQDELGMAITGQKLAGPLDGELFSITFHVIGNGTSTFSIDSAQVTNPTPDPSNPQQVGPALIPLVKMRGIFGNTGVVAFFNYQPDYPKDTIASPSLLPNQPVAFNASASIVPLNNTEAFSSYLWNFGDGPSMSASAVLDHTFHQPGNYTVALAVTDAKGEQGNFSLRLRVVPALGSLQLTFQDAQGNLQRQNVQVLLFNSSSSSTAIYNQTNNFGGQATIKSLTPGTYYLTYKGQRIATGSKTETVTPGFTQQDTIFVSIVPLPPDYSGIIYLGTILAGLGAISGAIIFQRRSARRKQKSDLRQPKRVKARK